MVLVLMLLWSHNGIASALFFQSIHYKDYTGHLAEIFIWVAVELRSSLQRIWGWFGVSSAHHHYLCFLL